MLERRETHMCTSLVATPSSRRAPDDAQRCSAPSRSGGIMRLALLMVMLVAALSASFPSKITAWAQEEGDEGASTTPTTAAAAPADTTTTTAAGAPTTTLPTVIPPPGYAFRTPFVLPKTKHVVAGSWYTSPASINIKTFSQQLFARMRLEAERLNNGSATVPPVTTAASSSGAATTTASPLSTPRSPERLLNYLTDEKASEGQLMAVTMCLVRQAYLGTAFTNRVCVDESKFMQLATEMATTTTATVDPSLNITTGPTTTLPPLKYPLYNAHVCDTVSAVQGKTCTVNPLVVYCICPTSNLAKTYPTFVTNQPLDVTYTSDVIVVDRNMLPWRANLDKNYGSNGVSDGGGGSGEASVETPTFDDGSNNNSTNSTTNVTTPAPSTFGECPGCNFYHRTRTVSPTISMSKGARTKTATAQPTASVADVHSPSASFSKSQVTQPSLSSENASVSLSLEPPTNRTISAVPTPSPSLNLSVSSSSEVNATVTPPVEGGVESEEAETTETEAGPSSAEETTTATAAAPTTTTEAMTTAPSATDGEGEGEEETATTATAADETTTTTTASTEEEATVEEGGGEEETAPATTTATTTSAPPVDGEASSVTEEEDAVEGDVTTTTTTATTAAAPSILPEEEEAGEESIPSTSEGGPAESGGGADEGDAALQQRRFKGVGARAPQHVLTPPPSLHSSSVPMTGKTMGSRRRKLQQYTADEPLPGQPVEGDDGDQTSPLQQQQQQQQQQHRAMSPNAVDLSGYVQLQFQFQLEHADPQLLRAQSIDDVTEELEYIHAIVNYVWMYSTFPIPLLFRRDKFRIAESYSVLPVKPVAPTRAPTTTTTTTTTTTAPTTTTVLNVTTTALDDNNNTATNLTEANYTTTMAFNETNATVLPTLLPPTTTTTMTTSTTTTTTPTTTTTTTTTTPTTRPSTTTTTTSTTARPTTATEEMTTSHFVTEDPNVTVTEDPLEVERRRHRPSVVRPLLYCLILLIIPAIIIPIACYKSWIRGKWEAYKLRNFKLSDDAAEADAIEMDDPSESIGIGGAASGGGVDRMARSAFGLAPPTLSSPMGGDDDGLGGATAVPIPMIDVNKDGSKGVRYGGENDLHAMRSGMGLGKWARSPSLAPTAAGGAGGAHHNSAQNHHIYGSLGFASEFDPVRDYDAKTKRDARKAAKRLANQNALRRAVAEDNAQVIQEEAEAAEAAIIGGGGKLSKQFGIAAAANTASPAKGHHARVFSGEDLYSDPGGDGGGGGDDDSDDEAADRLFNSSSRGGDLNDPISPPSVARNSKGGLIIRDEHNYMDAEEKAALRKRTAANVLALVTAGIDGAGGAAPAAKSSAVSFNLSKSGAASVAARSNPTPPTAGGISSANSKKKVIGTLSTPIAHEEDEDEGDDDTAVDHADDDDGEEEGEEYEEEEGEEEDAETDEGGGDMR